MAVEWRTWVGTPDVNLLRKIGCGGRGVMRVSSALLFDSRAVRFLSGSTLLTSFEV